MWLTSFKDFHLSDQQTKALVFVRELGAIDNSSYRSLNQVDTLSASNALRQLRDFDLLTQQNHGSATYYVPGQVFVCSLTSHESSDKGHQVSGKEHQLKSKGHQVNAKEHQLQEELGHNVLLETMPESLKMGVASLGKKASPEQIKAVIIALCAWQDMTAVQLTYILQRDKKRLVRKFLSPMIIKQRGLDYFDQNRTKWKSKTEAADEIYELLDVEHRTVINWLYKFRKVQ